MTHMVSVLAVNANVKNAHTPMKVDAAKMDATTPAKKYVFSKFRIQRIDTNARN